MESSLKVLADAGPDVFAFLDFRQFVSEYYNWRKARMKSFSWLVFSRQAGMTSESYLRLIVSGKRSLSVENSQKLASACRLEGDSARYFLALVQWNQAEDTTLKAKAWTDLKAIIPPDRFHAMTEQESAIMGTWYFLALMEFVNLKDFRADPEWIAKRMGYMVGAKEIAKTLERLLQLGLLRKDGERLVHGAADIFQLAEKGSEKIRQYHAMNIPVALKPLARVPAEKREFGAASFAIKKECLAHVKGRVRDFLKEIVQYCESGAEADQVYQLNVQLFPLTTEIDEEPK